MFLVHLLKRLRKLIDCRKQSEISKIPVEIDGEEKIVRVLLYPEYINKSTKTIKPSAFKPPKELDEVSVTRLDYCSADFCKDFGKKIQNPETHKSYYGLAVLLAKEIRDIGALIEFSPILDKEPRNPFHADIKYGVVGVKGMPFPSEITEKMDELALTARCYEDPNISIETWTGGDLT